jgi:hypothetical protein
VKGERGCLSSGCRDGAIVINIDIQVDIKFIIRWSDVRLRRGIESIVEICWEMGERWVCLGWNELGVISHNLRR